MSRLDQLKRDKVAPSFPPNPMPHVVVRLVEIGITENAGMGPAPLSWLTIDAWQRVTGVKLPPWEARLLRSLSTAYVAELQRAESETCPPPWHGKVTKREIDAETAILRSVLG